MVDDAEQVFRDFNAAISAGDEETAADLLAEGAQILHEEEVTSGPRLRRGPSKRRDLPMTARASWRRVSLSVVLGSVIATFAIAGPVAASPPQPVTISVVTDFGAENEDPFTATGDVICDAGLVSTTFSLFTGGQSSSHAQILVGKHFVCDDSSGTFDIWLRVTLSFTTFNTWGTWTVMDGTGDYDGLHGGGPVSGTSLGPEGILDYYTGEAHID